VKREIAMSDSNLKTFPFAEVVEHCCSMTSLQMGETMPNIAKDMDTYSYTLPLGKNNEQNSPRL
jgi:hypothetical protein